MKTLILAIGNTLLSDEGVGFHVLNAIKKSHENNHINNTTDNTITYLDGGTLSFTLADSVANTDNLIVIDAAQLNSPAGTVHCMVQDDMDAFLGACKRSVHEIGLLDLLDISRLTDSLPTQRALIGIQPDMIDWGDTLTASVQQAVPIATQYAIDLLQQWQQQEKEQLQ